MKASTVNRMTEWVFRVIVASVVCGVMYALAGCSTQYVPVETVRTDSIFIARLQRDSIFIRDSVYTKEKGDTVFKYKFKIVYKQVLQRDTMLTVRRDSIPIPIPVEKKRTWWEQTKIDVGGYAVTIIVIYVLCRLMRWFIMRTRKE